MKKLVIICISLLLLVGCGKKEKSLDDITQETLDTINQEREVAKQRNADSIGEAVRLAYTSYMMDNNGYASPSEYCNYMTNKYFKLDGAVLDTSRCYGRRIVNITFNNSTFTAIYSEGVVTITGAIHDIEIDLN